MTPARMAALHATSFPRGWSVAEINDLLAKPTTLAVTTPQGFAILQVVAPEAEILTIVIDPALRGQGHGGTLLRQALIAAAPCTVFLEVDATNRAALALYRAAGFTQTGTRKGYYTHPDGTRTDAILMTRATQTGT